MTMIKRCVNAFIYSSFFGIVANMLIELIVRVMTGFDYSPLTPEYIAMFSSYSIAFAADALLYGVLGLTFSAMLFLYELDRLGFVLQNLIYYVTTGLVWVPIITFMWQLQRYPKALYCTIVGFAVTDIIMTVVGYQTTKKNIAALNAALQK